MAFWNNDTKEKISKLESTNKDLVKKTAQLNSANRKINTLITSILGYESEIFTGETTTGEIGLPKNILIFYDYLRTRSWQFLIKNHIANLIVNKRVNWLIGSGLLFNSKPSEKPFIDYYGKDQGKKKHSEFIKEIEYQYRNYINTVEVDYEKKRTLHELARIGDYNASGDGDVAILMRIEKGLPTIQLISGQCVTNPALLEDIQGNNRVSEGVEFNEKGEEQAYHILTETNISNGVYIPNPEKNLEFRTRRVPVYFKGTKIRQAWLYKANDLQKLGETRAMPLLSMVFETLKHLNDYLIANAKNAQLLAQMVIIFERDKNATGEKMFNTDKIDVPGFEDTETPEAIADDLTVAQSADKFTRRLDGNGIIIDAPKGVSGKILNPESQANQKEYLESTLKTLFASLGIPYEVMLSNYDSNYSASMGARSDFQHNLDVLTEIIPSNQLYKMHYRMFLYMQVLKGEIECKPLLDAYQKNDVITISAITNSVFEGTKLKPIDPVKFINSLRMQLPESIRQKVPLNTMENLVNSASNGDYQSVLNQILNEQNLLGNNFDMETPDKTNQIEDIKTFLMDINDKLEELQEK